MSPFRIVQNPPFEHDQQRIPATEKAKRILGFEATISLESVLDELLPWVRSAIKAGRI